MTESQRRRKVLDISETGHYFGQLEMERAGFKEWAVVCEALGSGRQSIILRKGGIAEGRDGFSFKHREFFLFPTWFHEQPEKVRESFALNVQRTTLNAQRSIQTSAAMPQSEDVIEIRFAAELTASRTITSWEVAEALEPLHILRPEVIRERFDYDEAPGLHVAFVRAYRLNRVWRFPNQKKYGGCRSWVDLPEMPNNLRLEAVLTDEEHEKRFEEFLAIVDEPLATAVPSP